MPSYPDAPHPVETHLQEKRTRREDKRLFVIFWRAWRQRHSESSVTLNIVSLVNTTRVPALELKTACTTLQSDIRRTLHDIVWPFTKIMSTPTRLEMPKHGVSYPPPLGPMAYASYFVVHTCITVKASVVRRVSRVTSFEIEF